MDFVVTLNEQSKEPVYRQLAGELRKAILDGRLQPGDKMPSTRDLCRSMKVSRFTVMRSFEDLSAQGFIKTISGSGTYVVNPIPAQATDNGSRQVKSDKMPHPRLSEGETRTNCRSCLPWCCRRRWFPHGRR